jgi:hypothetical protein
MAVLFVLNAFCRSFSHAWCRQGDNCYEGPTVTLPTAGAPRPSRCRDDLRRRQLWVAGVDDHVLSSGVDATKFIPFWVKIAVAIAPGLGTNP